MSGQVRTIALYVDRFNPPYAGLISNMISICGELGMELTAAVPSMDHLATFDLSEGDPDVAVVLGGDGSILRGMDHFLGEGIPVLGINAGHLGFLASAEKEDMLQILTSLASGDFMVEPLPLIRGEYPSGKLLRAVNDFSVNRSMMGGILHFEIFVGGARVATVAGDGLVVSTPMGSTAYGLSCGGPILDPGLPAILVVPICAHSLSLRPLVVPDTLTVSVRIGELRGTGPVVSADGRPSGTLKESEIFRISKDEGVIRVIRFTDQPGYYHRLGKKLGWGSRG